MEPINLKDLQRFVGAQVEVVIQDLVVKDQAPAVQKTMKKIQFCPDKTHIRFYFDDFYFLAVPLASQIKDTEFEWSALDQETGLQYIFKKVQVFK